MITGGCRLFQIMVPQYQREPSIISPDAEFACNIQLKVTVEWQI